MTHQVKVATLVMQVSEATCIHIYLPLYFEAKTTICGSDSLLKDFQLYYKVATISNFITSKVGSQHSLVMLNSFQWIFCMVFIYSIHKMCRNNTPAKQSSFIEAAGLCLTSRRSSKLMLAWLWPGQHVL